LTPPKVFSPPAQLFARVLLAEDDLVMGEWIGSGLSRKGVELHWCQDAPSAEHALRAREGLFHSVITDIYMGNGERGGLKVLKAAKELDLPVFVITSQADLEIAKDAIDCGAYSLLEKPFEIESLMSKLTECWQEPRHLAAYLERHAEVSGLTEKEKEVCRLLVKGLANKEIASVLGVTEKTIKFHVTSIFQKFGVGSRAELVSTIFPT